MKRWSSVRAVPLLIAIATVFASNHVAARLAFDHGAGIGTAVVVRSLAAMVFVVVLLRAAKQPIAMPRPTLARALVIGLLVTAQSYCLYSAVARIPVALALLAFNTFPLLLTVVDGLMHRRAPSRMHLLAMLIALTGLALALGAFDRFAPAGSALARAASAQDWRALGVGVGFGVTAAAIYAVAWVLTLRWLGEVDGRLRTLSSMMVVALVTSVLTWLFSEFAWPRDAAGWIGLAMCSVLYSIAITSLFVVLPRVGPVSNAGALNFEPIASLGLGWLLLGQAMTITQVIGALVVVAAIVTIAARR